MILSFSEYVKIIYDISLENNKFKIFEVFNSAFFGVCILDDRRNRFLQGHFEANNQMTIQMCISICRSKNYKFAGVEWQIECYCDNELRSFFKWAWPGKCEDRCAGDFDQVCGGSDALNLWTVPKKNLDGICVYNSPTNEILYEYQEKGHENLTVEECQSICKGKELSIGNQSGLFRYTKLRVVI